ncbi:hypothetical protein M5K25_026771 [Dendrobium thyrsiflorum]|uniref:Transmembrane protein n=1 Tax=Dendrobium thyrsiflorum TaxID=117978 RepID=A0ABD0TY52_DENTH
MGCNVITNERKEPVEGKKTIEDEGKTHKWDDIENSLKKNNFFGRLGFTGRSGTLKRALERADQQRRQARRGEHKMAGGDSSTGSGGGFRSRLEHFLYSGDKKHVFAGIAIISVVFGAPWFFMNRGSKHQSHQDYMEKADKARSQRLSSGQPSVR